MITHDLCLNYIKSHTHTQEYITCTNYIPRIKQLQSTSRKYPTHFH